MTLLLNAANVIASIAGAIAADTATAGAGAAITGALSLEEVLRRLAGKAPAVQSRIAAELQAECAAHHLTEAQKTLIPQMIERAPLTPAEVMAATRNPARLCAAMLEKLTDPAHQTPQITDAFTRVVTPVLTRLLADSATSEALRPAFEDAVAESLRFIGDQVEILTLQMANASERAAVAEFVVMELARRFVPGIGGDFESARRDLEKALEIFVVQQAEGALPHNHGEAIDFVFDEVNRLNALAQFDQAAVALDLALHAEQEESKARQQASIARQAAILDRGVDQDRLRNNPASATKHLIERLQLDTPTDPLVALRSLWMQWYERGRDQGLAFDATVAIHLAEHSLARARTADERGEALYCLGLASKVLGERETNTNRLRSAVVAFSSALKECPCNREPLFWIQTMINLGNTVRRVGENEGNMAWVSRAVDIYRKVETICTRGRELLLWAQIKGSLGYALYILGVYENSPTHLDEAVTALEAALEVFARRNDLLHDRTLTLNTLGNALTDLGRLEPGTERLDAARAAFNEVLKQRLRDRVPLDRATTQFGLGRAELFRFCKTDHQSDLASARGYVTAAHSVFVAKNAELYIKRSEQYLSEIATLETL